MNSDGKQSHYRLTFDRMNVETQVESMFVIPHQTWSFFMRGINICLFYLFLLFIASVFQFFSSLCSDVFTVKA